MLIKV